MTDQDSVQEDLEWQEDEIERLEDEIAGLRAQLATAERERDAARNEYQCAESYIARYAKEEHTVWRAKGKAILDAARAETWKAAAKLIESFGGEYFDHWRPPAYAPWKTLKIGTEEARALASHLQAKASRPTRTGDQ